MNTKIKRRPIARLMAVLMALAMVVSVVFVQVSADKAKFDAPTSPKAVNEKNWITTAAHSQGWITPEVLGITNTTARPNPEMPENPDGTVAMTLAQAQTSPALGVFGSDINDEANPYHYNYFYNAWAKENNATPVPVGQFTLSVGITGGPMHAATQPAACYTKFNGYQSPASFYLEPDILLGVGTVVKNKYSTTTDYTKALADYNEKKAAYEGENYKEYEPYQIAYENQHVYSFLKTLYDLADTCKAIQAEDPTKETRYGDPTVIAEDVEKYVKGLESYVIKKMKEDNSKPVTVAVVDNGYTTTLKGANSIDANEYAVNTKDVSSQPTTTYSRVGEFVNDTATNIVDAIGGLEVSQTAAENKTYKYYVVNADQIAEKADIILFCDVTASVPEGSETDSAISEFRRDFLDNVSNELKDRAKKIQIMSSTFDCVGSIGANSVENLLGMAYYTAYMYPQYLNQFEVAAYWYQHFYHISDLNTLPSIIAANFANSSVQDGVNYKASTMNYDEQSIEDKIIEGMNYYEDNKEEFKDKLIYQNGKTGENTGWEIDWTRGIGANTERCPAGGTHNVTAIPAKEATCTEKGLTAGEKCADCDKVLKAQEEVPALGHDFKDGKCTRCGATDPNYKPSEPDDPTPVDPTPVVKQNGLADSADSNGDWWFYKDGKIDTTHNGVDQNKYGWWRVENGKVNFNAQSIYQNQFGWWKTTNGKVTFKEEGVFQNGFGWWRVKDSKVDFNAQSIYQNKFGWWKTTNGKVTFKENGLFSNQYGTWKVENSKVNFNFNGKYQGKTIKNGKVV